MHGCSSCIASSDLLVRVAAFGALRKRIIGALEAGRDLDEVFGRVAVQEMAMRILVIVRAVGPAEVVRDGSTWRVPRPDRKAAPTWWTIC
jgi:hypothetical protein